MADDTILGTLEIAARSREGAVKTYEALEALWKRLPADIGRMTTGMQFGEQAKYVSWRFSDEQVRKWGALEILQVTDVQWGHVCCKRERVVEYRDWVLAKENRFLALTGDNVDAWALWSPGTPFEQLLNPQAQVMSFAEVWAPVRHRILGYVGGNHERRALPGFGDLGILLATLLKIPYSAGKQLIDIHFGKHAPFKVSLWHGRGGARTKGTVAQTLHRFMSDGDSQLYLMGHLHQPMVIPDWRTERVPGRNRVRMRKVIGAVGSSFLENWGSYAEVAGFSAGDVMMARAVLQADGHWEVTLR